MAGRGQPILSLVSRVFLNERRRIMEELNHSGHRPLLYYALQQVRQFRRLGEDFAMQHKDSQYLGEVDEDLETAVLDLIPPEKFVRRHTPGEILELFKLEEILEHLKPREILDHLTPEEMVKGLSEEKRARLRELLERQPGKTGSG